MKLKEMKFEDKFTVIFALVGTVIIVAMCVAIAQQAYTTAYASEKFDYEFIKGMGWELKACTSKEYRPDWKVLFGYSPERYLFAENIFKATKSAWEEQGEYQVYKTDNNLIRICPISHN